MSKGTRRKRNKAFKAQVRAMQAKYQQGQVQATSELAETKRLAKLEAEDKLRTQFKLCKYRSFTGIWCAVHPDRDNCNDCLDYTTL